MLRPLASIEERPAGSIGRENQLRHTRARLENVTVALEKLPGTRPFPDGADLSQVT
ncbi:MAG TPA: hypothetical protein VJ787_01560 [Thermoleophilia bacterium]|nr:hypothetical protein [Thermoleophilia bacterium]